MKKKQYVPGFRRTLSHTIVFPEDGDAWLFLNFGTHVPHYTALQPSTKQ
jgi:hypothetical protein